MVRAALLADARPATSEVELDAAVGNVRRHGRGIASAGAAPLAEVVVGQQRRVAAGSAARAHAHVHVLGSNIVGAVDEADALVASSAVTRELR